VKAESWEIFEAAFRDAVPLIAGMPGFHRLRLSRCLERPTDDLLLVEWSRLEDHTEGFRASLNIKDGAGAFTTSTPRHQRRTHIRSRCGRLHASTRS
jgi:heme-degrading monooxygenase HmoA